MLWLWRRPVATAPIRPLAWEPPYAAGAAQEIATITTTTTKRQKTKKKEKKRKEIGKIEVMWLQFNFFYTDTVTQIKITEIEFIRRPVSWIFKSGLYLVFPL